MNEPDYLKILKECRNIAIVGLSPNRWRASYDIGGYLLRTGYEVVGVNPNYGTVLGRPCYPSLKAVPGPVDLVNVFRDPAQVLPVVEEAIEIGAKVVWMQLGVVNEAAASLAQAAGLVVVQDRCIKIEHARLRTALQS